MIGKVTESTPAGRVVDEVTLILSSEEAGWLKDAMDLLSDNLDFIEENSASYGFEAEEVYDNTHVVWDVLDDLLEQEEDEVCR